MKVFHLITSLSVGGAELHLLTLCRYLRRAGLEVVVGYLQEGRGSRPLRKDFEEMGIRVVYLDGKRPWDVRHLVRARLWVEREQPDILHTHLPRADLVGSLAKAVGFRGVWICSVHDIYSRSWRGRRLLPLFRFVWRRADRVIAISQAVKDWLVQEHRLPPEKVEVVYYGIETERWERPGKDLRGLWGLGEGPLVGSVGRLEPRKGHDILIRAMALVAREVPRAHLLIAGHDPWGYGRSLWDLVTRLGLDGNVRLLGFQEDIPSFMHALDVFAFASRSEGFGQVVVEAMASGRPVVVSRVPPLTEIVTNGKTGLWAELESPESFARAILHLLRNPEQAREMGARARERARARFHASRMTEATLEIYRKVLEVKA